MSDSCFELEGWDEFVERFSQFVDKWEAGYRDGWSSILQL